MSIYINIYIYIYLYILLFVVLLLTLIPRLLIPQSQTLHRTIFCFFSDSAVGTVPSGHAAAQVAALSVPARLPEHLSVQSAQLLPTGGSGNECNGINMVFSVDLLILKSDDDE